MDKKKYPDKVSESGVIYVDVQDPRTSQIANYVVNDGENDVVIDNPKQIRIPVVFDYIRSEVSDEENEWWYYDYTNTVHILFEEDLRVRIRNLMKVREQHKLTKAEAKELNMYEMMLNILPQKAANEAIKKYANTIFQELDKSAKTSVVAEEATVYRTKKRAGDVAEIPSKMPIITNKKYINAMTYNDDNAAYLQPLSSADGLVFENGKLFFEGLPASAARIKHLYTKDNIENFDLPLLRVFYAIILNKFKQTWREDQSIEEVITIYYPDLAKQLGKSTNISRTDVESTINSILSFRNIMGVTEKGKNVLPVLVYMGEEREKNTISFASPYMVKVIKDIYNASIRKSKQGLEMKKKDGTPQFLPAYTYLPNLTLAKERNKKAVEIVCIVVTVIDNTGMHGIPHISAKTIIERNQLLKQSLENTRDTSNQNKILKRAFSKAWELLRTHTDVMEKYKNIQLPDPKTKDFRARYIPTMKTLDMVFEFPHEGKVKD